MKLIFKENKNKKPVRLFTDPRYQGADVDYDYIDTLPTVEIPVDKIVYWEKDKVISDFFKKEVLDMIKYLETGKKLPPIVVMETGFFKKQFLVIDGHHRAVAFKQMGYQKIPAKIVPKNKVKKQGGIPTLDENQVYFMVNIPIIGK